MINGKRKAETTGISNLMSAKESNCNITSVNRLDGWNYGMNWLLSLILIEGFIFTAEQETDLRCPLDKPPILSMEYSRFFRTGLLLRVPTLEISVRLCTRSTRIATYY